MDVCTVQRNHNQQHIQDGCDPGIYLHGNAVGESALYGNFHPILVLGLLDREHGQYLDDHRPHGHVRKVPPSADAPAESERNVFDVIGIECAVAVEKAFWDKFVGVGVFGFIVAH